LITEATERITQPTERTLEATDTPLPYEGKYTQRKQKRRRAKNLRRFFNEEL